MSSQVENCTVVYIHSNLFQQDAFPYGIQRTLLQAASFTNRPSIEDVNSVIHALRSDLRALGTKAGTSACSSCPAFPNAFKEEQMLGQSNLEGNFGDFTPAMLVISLITSK